MKYLFILLVSYFLPRTDLQIVVHYDETTVNAGPFYQYSERFLGTKDAATKDQTTFQITSIEIRQVASPDPNRRYDLSANKTPIQPLLNLTGDGVLMGYNIDNTPKPQRRERKEQDERRPITDCAKWFFTLPLLEEQLQASSTSKMAEGAAKLIYRIREARMALLSGEQEHAPADGAALKRTIDEMNERENELTELFVGKRRVTHHEKVITYHMPASAPAKAETVLRFSKHYGPVANDDLSGEPVKLTFKEIIPAGTTTAQENMALYYIEPARVTISVTMGENELKTTTLNVPQWGNTVGLSADLFTKGNLPHITINPKTGALIQITK